jgi:hypothetical protein
LIVKIIPPLLEEMSTTLVLILSCISIVWRGWR